MARLEATGPIEKDPLAHKEWHRKKDGKKQTRFEKKRELSERERERERTKFQNQDNQTKTKAKTKRKKKQ